MWTHSICIKCWNKRNPDRQAVTIADQFREMEICCFCGQETRDGIYVREDPKIPQFCQHKED